MLISSCFAAPRGVCVRSNIVQRLSNLCASSTVRGSMLRAISCHVLCLLVCPWEEDGVGVWDGGWGWGGCGVSFAFLALGWSVTLPVHDSSTDGRKFKDEEGTIKSLLGRKNNYSFNFQERELSALDWPESPTTTSPRHYLKT